MLTIIIIYLLLKRTVLIPTIKQIFMVDLILDNKQRVATKRWLDFGLQQMSFIAVAGVRYSRPLINLRAKYVAPIFC